MEKHDILKRILTQISAFDTKASILIAVVGVIFSLVSSFIIGHDLQIFSDSYAWIGWLYKSLVILFFLNSLFAMLCMVLVILPRRRKEDGTLYANYYSDIVKIPKEELDEAIKNLDIDGQIKINAAICLKKEKWLRVGLISLAPLAALLACITIIIVFM